MPANPLFDRGPKASVALRTVDRREAGPNAMPAALLEPPVFGTHGQQIKVAMAPASSLNFLAGSATELSIGAKPMVTLSEFEEGLVDDRSQIRHAIVDPASGEIIGYSLVAVAGLPDHRPGRHARPRIPHGLVTPYSIR